MVEYNITIVPISADFIMCLGDRITFLCYLVIQPNEKNCIKISRVKCYHYPTPTLRDNTIYKYCAAKPDDGLNVKTTPTVWNLLPWMLDSPTTDTRIMYLDWSLTKMHIPILLFNVYYCSSQNYKFAEHLGLIL